jgi:hypothetical protein
MLDLAHDLESLAIEEADFGVLLRLEYAVLHRGFNTPHIIGYIWGYSGASNDAFVDVCRMCTVQEHAGVWQRSNISWRPEREFANYDDMIEPDGKVSRGSVWERQSLFDDRSRTC